MSIRLAIAALIVVILLVVAAGFTTKNIRKKKASKNRDPRPQRKGDKHKLNRHQKRIYDSATQLLANGKHVPAAQLFESIGLVRDAISTLEDSGHIQEAANILLRMQLPNRAGVVYARHKKWREATRCFALAQMPLETAKCAVQAGDLDLAAKEFLKANRYSEAAECFVELGQYRSASKLYAASGDTARAVELYKQLVSQADDLSTVSLDEKEIQMVVDYLGAGKVDVALADLVNSRDRLSEVILPLVRKGMLKQAAEIYLRSTHDMGPKLMSEINYLDPAAMNLAQVFAQVSNYQYAGMVLQTLQKWQAAAEAFEKADDLERAVFCFEKAGLESRVVDVRIRIASKPRRSQTMAMPRSDVPKESDSPFALGSVTSSSLISSDAPGTEDRTEVMTADARSKVIQDKALENLKSPGAQQAHEFESEFNQMQFLIDLSVSERRRVWALGETKHYTRGQVILDLGVEPEGIYFVLRGSVGAYLRQADGDQLVNKVEPKDSFGEFWLMAEIAPTVKFVADSLTVIHVVDKQKFINLMEKDGTVARKLYKRFTYQMAASILTTDNKKTFSAA